MGAPPNFLHNLKEMVLENKENSTPTPTSTTMTSNNPSNDDNSLCNTSRAKLRQTRRKPKHLRKNKRVSMKKRRPTSSQRDENGIDKKVQILQRLIPNPNPESTQGLDGLFRDTASYIISLQMRVRVMQLMVNVLETSQHFE